MRALFKSCLRKGMFFALVLACNLDPYALAEVTEPAPQSQPTPATPDASPTLVKKKRKGKILREKEAEGTQAPNRFDTDTIIKSKYKSPDGQPLEVDTE